MTIKTLSDLFLQALKDALYAERRVLAASPAMECKASDSRLKAVLSFHREESEAHVARLEQVFDSLGKPPRGSRCDVVSGLLAKADSLMAVIEDGHTMDAALISLAREVEHTEIARYGSLVAWSSALGQPRAEALLKQTLREEQRAEQALSRLALTPCDSRTAA
jgi:ferritin-like metal-binding protein YciE